MIRDILNKYHRHNKNKYAKRKKKELERLFPSSEISIETRFDKKTILEGYNVINSNVNISSSKVGYATVIGGGTNLENCEIGRFCSIAGNVHIQPWTHPIDFVSTYPSFFKTSNKYPFGKGCQYFNESIKCDNGRFCMIGNDVWIGESVIIKGGVTIGDGAIIGMGAVVTKDVPSYAIVGGVPTKVIKYRFDKKTIEALSRLKWWNWPIDQIKERREEFIDVPSFVKRYDIKENSND